VHNTFVLQYIHNRHSPNTDDDGQEPRMGEELRYVDYILPLLYFEIYCRAKIYWQLKFGALRVYQQFFQLVYMCPSSLEALNNNRSHMQKQRVGI